MLLRRNQNFTSTWRDVVRIRPLTRNKFRWTACVAQLEIQGIKERKWRLNEVHPNRKVTSPHAPQIRTIRTNRMHHLL
jgi:hypothetical protein